MIPGSLPDHLVISCHLSRTNVQDYARWGTAVNPGLDGSCGRCLNGFIVTSASWVRHSFKSFDQRQRDIQLVGAKSASNIHGNQFEIRSPVNASEMLRAASHIVTRPGSVPPRQKNNRPLDF